MLKHLNSLLVKAVSKYPVYNTVKKRNEVPDSLDSKIINDVKNVIKKKDIITLNYNVKNTYRAIGTQLSSYLTQNLNRLCYQTKIAYPTAFT